MPAPAVIVLLAASLRLSAVPAPANLEARVHEIFEDACAMCHDDADDDVDLESQPSGLLGKASSTGRPLIKPGEPERSYLYLKLTDESAIEGDLMPQDEDPLSADQLATIREWIQAMPADAAPAAETSGEGAVPARKARAPFAGTHQIALHTTTTLARNEMEFRVHHRFGRAGVERSYAGLAGGAVISLGLAYGIVDAWDVLLRFSTLALDWELGSKFVPLRQEAGMPLSLGGYASLEIITQTPETAANRTTGNFQLFASRLWLTRWSTQATVGYSLMTNHSPHPVVTINDIVRDVRDRRATLNVGVASTWWIGKKRRHGIDLEYIQPIPSSQAPDRLYYHGGDANPDGTTLGSWSLGWSARTGLHLFQIFLTNTRSIHTNQVAPGGDLGNPLAEWGEFFVGFNLSRRWKQS